MARKPHIADDPVLVVGLGRFGSAVAAGLMRLGIEVLGVDENMELVQKFANDLTHTVSADSTDTEAMEQLGAGNFTRAVVAIGTDVEASVLTVVSLHELGVREIWAKAITVKHGQILTHIGASHVVYPEREAGTRVAHIVSGAMSDYMEFEDGTCVARTRARPEIWGRTIERANLREDHGILTLAVRRHGERLVPATPLTEIHQGDDLLVSGTVADVERYCGLSLPE